MLIQPIDYFLVGWFVLVAISTLWVGVDQFRSNPEPTVMKWGFILVTLYLGPIGALLYVLADKEPRPGSTKSSQSPSGSRASDRPFTAWPETRRESSPPR